MNTPPGVPGLLGVIDVPVMGVAVLATRVHVIEGTRGPILIDSGWDDEIAWQALTDGLSAIDLDVRNVEGVILTHHHPDHSGLAGRIRDVSDAWIAMHSLDAALVASMRTTESEAAHLAWELDNLAAAGAPPPALAAYRDSGGSYSMAIPSAEVDRPLEDGDHVPSAAGGLTALWLPGHTSGHMGVILEEQHAVFTGDHLLSKTSPHVGEFVFPIDEHGLLGRYLTSLDKLHAMIGDGYSVHPAHEAVDIDWRGRIDELGGHHQRRLADIRSVLADGGPRTLWQVAEQMSWATPWEKIEPIGWQLALSECSAHVTYLVETAEVVTDSSGKPPVTFTAVHGLASSA